MQLPVIIRADDGVPMPEEAAERDAPGRLVPRLQAFVPGEVLQPGSIVLEAQEQLQPPRTPSPATPSATSDLGAHVASLYRSLVEPKRKRKARKRDASVVVIDDDEATSSCAASAVTHATVTATPATPATPATDALYCEFCAAVVPADAAEEHLRSTLHCFNLQYRPARGRYFLNEGNAGYRLLSRMNWTEDRGLGAHEQGQLEPVRTRLKHDRAGLGAPSAQPLRVTHTAVDVAAEQARQRSEKRRGRAGNGRREVRQRVENERQQEARLRDALYGVEYPGG